MAITAQLDYGLSSSTVWALFVRSSDNFAWDAEYVELTSATLRTASVAAEQIGTTGLYAATSAGADGTVLHDIYWWDIATPTWETRLPADGIYDPRMDGLATEENLNAKADAIGAVVGSVPAGVAAMLVAAELARYVDGDSGPLQWTETALELGPHDSGNIGPGGIATTIAIKSTAGALLSGASTWITSDSAGATTIAGTLESNSLGRVMFMLNAGVNYLWRTSPTYNFPNPQPITVEGSSMSIAFSDGTVVAGPASGYAVRSDLENIFGANVVKWSILSANDPDSPAGLAEITERVNWAIVAGAGDFENRMRQSIYALPISGPTASNWATRIVAILAGKWLYIHSRHAQRGDDGKVTFTGYEGADAYAEEQMDFAMSNKIRLDAALKGKGTNAPFATHERGRGAYGPGSGGYGTGPLPPPGPFAG